MKKYIRIIIPVMIFVAAAAFILFLPDVSPSVDDDTPQVVEYNCSEGIHNYTVENKCALCGEALKYTEGLVYAEYADGYKFTGIPSELKPNVKDLVIPYGYNGRPVVAIGEDVCQDNGYIESVTIPSSVKLIDHNAFSGCVNLKKINLPDVPLRIGMSFVNTAFIKDESNWEDGILYAGKHLIGVKIDNSGSLKIKNGTLSVAGYLIHYNGFNPAAYPKISEVEIPKSVKIIETNAFSGWKILSNITLPKGLEYIGSNILSKTKFSENESNWENGLLYNGNYLLSSNTDVYPVCQIKNETELIAAGAFSQNTVVKEIVIPESVERIEDGAFKECSALEKIRLPENLKYIGTSAFEKCSALKEIELPESLEFMGESIFYGCTSLESIVLPDKIKHLPENAFLECTALKSVKLPDELEIFGQNAFAKCSALESIIVPNTVKTIGRGTFYECISLKSVRLPSKLENIEGSAFWYCSNITEITLPHGLKSIGANAFSGCSLLNSIIIPSSVTDIGQQAFSGCESITEITIPDGITSIADGMFNCCKKLVKIDIPSSVRSIGSRVFRECSALAEINGLDGVVEIRDAFLTDTAFYANVSNWENGALYIGKVLVAANENISADYTVKEGTAAIAESAFANNAKITKVTIPDSVQSIGNSAFENCSLLTDVRLSENITVIPQTCFTNCAKLKKIEIPSGVTEIGWGAFEWCTAIKSVVIPDKVANLSASVFLACTSLEQVVLPNGLTTLSSRVFYECTKLKTVNLPDSLIYVGNNVFSGCSLLEEIHLPKSVQFVGSNAFSDTAFYAKESNWDGNALYLDGWLVAVKDFTETEFKLKDGTVGIASNLFLNNTTLKKIEIPASVKTIGDAVFRYCSSLEEVILAEPTGWVLTYQSQTKVLDVDLGDPSIAAEALKSNSYHTWTRGEQTL